MSSSGGRWARGWWLIGAMVCAGLGGPAVAQEIPENARRAVEEAGRLKSQGDLAGARRRLGDALMIAPAWGEAWWLNAWVRLGFNDPGGARQAFGKAARLLPPDDPRVAQAQAKLAALPETPAPPPAVASAPAPAAPRPPIITAAEPLAAPAGANPWAGWPAGLLALVALLGLTAIVSAWWADRCQGPASPAGRYDQLARRLARGAQVPVDRVLALALHPALAWLPEADRAALLAAAAASHPPSRQKLVQWLTTATGARQRLLALALARQDEAPAPGVWTGLLDSVDPLLRQAALQGLGRQPDTASVPLLANLARSTQPDEALLAVASLARLDTAPALTALVALLAEAGCPAAATAALEALGQRPRLPASLGRALAQRLDAPGVLPRPALLQALAATGEGGRPRLLEALLDTDPPLRAAALAALRDRPGDGSSPKAWARELAEQPVRITLEALDWLHETVPKAAVAVAERVLAEPAAAAPARQRAVAVMASQPGPAATQVMLRTLESLDPSTPNETALAGLLVSELARPEVPEPTASPETAEPQTPHEAKVGNAPPEAVERKARREAVNPTGMAETADENARAEAIEEKLPRGGAGQHARQAVTSELARPEAVGALPALLAWAAARPDESVWAAAAEVLAGAVDSGPALAAALSAPDPAVRRMAAARLVAHPRPEAAEALLAELARAGTPEAVPDLLPDVIAALGALGEARALPLLQTLPDRCPDLAGDRLDIALARLGDAAAVSRVEAILLRPDPVARRPAAEWFATFDPIPPRAREVVAEAEAHAAAEALAGPAETQPADLIALGPAVIPTLRNWLTDPARRPLAEAALAQLEPKAAPGAPAD